MTKCAYVLALASMSNIQTVQEIYAAFGRADVPAILSRLHDNVAWDQGATDDAVAWLQTRSGRQDVIKFFEALAEVEITRFEPWKLIDGGDTVVTLVRLEAVVKATGKTIVEDEEVHVWHFDSAGLVTSFRHRIDTHKAWLAYQATS